MACEKATIQRIFRELHQSKKPIQATTGKALNSHQQQINRIRLAAENNTENNVDAYRRSIR